MTADAERLAAITPGSWDQLIALAGEFAADNDALRARIEAAETRGKLASLTELDEALGAMRFHVPVHELIETLRVEYRAALAGDQPEATPEPQSTHLVDRGAIHSKWEKCYCTETRNHSAGMEATPEPCRVCGNPRQESGHPECPSSHAEDAPEPNEEEFCGRCFAGVDSDEHHGKCVVPGHAEMGESASEPPHLDPVPMTIGPEMFRHALSPACERSTTCKFNPRPADENGKAYSDKREDYPAYD